MQREVLDEAEYITCICACAYRVLNTSLCMSVPLRLQCICLAPVWMCCITIFGVCTSGRLLKDCWRPACAANDIELYVSQWQNDANDFMTVGHFTSSGNMCLKHKAVFSISISFYYLLTFIPFIIRCNPLQIRVSLLYFFTSASTFQQRRLTIRCAYPSATFCYLVDLSFK